jgi:hypothetical protein
MTTLADLIIKVGADTGDAEKGLTGLEKLAKNKFTALTAAGVAAGGGLEAFAQKMAPLNEANSQLAAMTGLSSDAMRELAIDTANVTFPLDEAQDLIRTGAERGLEGADALGKYATFWDMVGDATGEAGPELGKAGVALNAVGIAAGDEAEALDAFGFITDKTTGNVADFLAFIERTGPELGELGADVDDAAAILGILESEFGMTGRVARTEFRSAVAEAEGDMGKLLDTLGISEATFSQYSAEVENSGDVMKRNAEIHAESFTPMQKLQHSAEELMFQYGGLADVAGAAALPMMALGPVAKGATMAVKGVGKSSKGIIKGVRSGSLALMTMGRTAMVAGGNMMRAAGFIIASGARMAASMLATAARVVAAWVVMAVQSLINAARMALSWIIAFFPVAVVIAIVAGLVYLIIKHWDTIWKWTKKIFGLVWDFIRGVWDKVWAFVGKAIAGIKNIFFKFHPVGIIIKNWQPIWGFITGLWDKVIGRIRGAVAKIKGFLSGMWEAAKSGARSALNGAIGLVNRAIGGINTLIRAANRLPGVSIPQISSIPHLAKGGIVTGPTLAVLGEGGRDEAVIPLPRGMRPGDGATMPRELPDEFVAEATIDLGEGIRQVVELRFKRANRTTKRRVGAGTGRAR